MMRSMRRVSNITRVDQLIDSKDLLRGFISGVLLTSLFWSLGLIYITYNSVSVPHSDHVVRAVVPPSEEVERWATNRKHTRLQHGSDKDVIMYKKMRQVKRATMSRPTISRPTELQENKDKFIHNIAQKQPIRFNDIQLSEHRQAINDNRIVPVQRETITVVQPTSRQLFISDKSIVVKNFLSWKEAEKTYTFEEEQESKDGFTRHAFNQYASDRLGYFREIPDTRHTLCHSLQYPLVTDLPNTSIIICFHNEAQSALLRTVHSVIQRSPAELLHEIILVDDASTFDDLKGPLDQYIADHLPIVMVVRATRREGLIRARLLGARHATGEVLTFLDSHCEVNSGWLEPLLTRLKDKPTEAVVPVIDIINQKSLEYTWVGLNKGGFNWGLNFKWHPLNEHTWSDNHRKVQPFKSPTMAGGLFSIYREYFFNIGSYDEGMDIWGGENVEISLRLWMCGGGLEIIPCSRVGHIFRGHRPYSSPGGDAMGRNTIRVAEVWLDDYKEYVYKNNPSYRSYKYGDISGRQLLREQLHCRPFSWYLHNVYPELKIPSDNTVNPSSSIVKKSSLYKGQLRDSLTGHCITLGNGNQVNQHSVTMETCDINSRSQVWSYTDNNQIKHVKYCLEPLITGDKIIATSCKDANSDTDKSYLPQLWEYKSSSKLLHMVTGKCLYGVHQLKLDSCENRNITSWSFIIS